VGGIPFYRVVAIKMLEAVVVLATVLIVGGQHLSEQSSSARQEAEVSIITPLTVRHKFPVPLAPFKHWFSKFVPILPGSKHFPGVHVVASRNVPDRKVERIANVLAEFLDNDEDGKVDNPHVAMHMQKRGATMIMFGDADELEQSGFDDVPGFDTQDCEGDETGVTPGRVMAHVMTAEAVGENSMACLYHTDMLCDAPLEEVLHLVTDVGFAYAYPKVFGTRAGSAIAITMDELIANCGHSSQDTPLGKYSKYSFPDCIGKYHYTDETCEYGCLIAEYVHHFVASYNGEYPFGRPGVVPDNACGTKDKRAGEWELCAVAKDGNLSASRELLKRGDPDGFSLLTDPIFRLPLRMPDGKYKPPPNSSAVFFKVDAHAERAVLGFQHISLEGKLRRRHRMHVAGKVQTEMVKTVKFTNTKLKGDSDNTVLV